MKSELQNKIAQCEADIASLQENKKKLEKELKNKDRNLPIFSGVGTVYHTPNGWYMLVSIGEYVGFTAVNDYPGCHTWRQTFNSSSQAIHYIRNETNWTYVGTFNELFERKS